MASQWARSHAQQWRDGKSHSDGGTDAQTIHLFDLPNEILGSILMPLRTQQLLPLTAVCQKFHNIILRILHFRLLQAASASEYKIILEAYLPSRRYTRPYLYCTYLGTDGLSGQIEGRGSLYEDLERKQEQRAHGLGAKSSAVAGKLAKLGGLYSRFRPEYPDVKGSMPVRRIAGAAPNLQSNTAGLQQDWFAAPENNSVIGSADGVGIASSASNSTEGVGQESEDTNAADQVQQQQQQQVGDAQQALAQSQPIWADGGDGGFKKVVYRLNFDADELFDQLCIAATLVHLGPRRGVFLCYVPIVRDKQGVIRVWKEHLIRRSKALIDSVLGEKLKRTPTDLRPEDIACDPDVLWTDYTRSIGLRLGIKELPVEGTAMRDPDEDRDDIPLSFELEIKELIVRTTKLMLTVEESQEKQTTSGKSLIFGSFAVAAD